MVTKITIPPFITTLNLIISIKNINIIITNKHTIYFTNYPIFKTLTQKHLFNILPYPIFYLIIITLINTYILKKTIINHYIYTINNNKITTHLSNIKIQHIKIFIYTFYKLLTKITNIILTSHLNSKQPTININYKLKTITTIIINKTNLINNINTINNTIINTFIINILKNNLNLINISQF